MSKVKDFLNDKKGKQIALMVGGILILFLILFLFLLLKGRKLTYSELENELYYATIQYIQENPSSAPNGNTPEITVSVESLVHGKYIKEMSKLIKDNCNANITVLYVNNTYHVKPFLTCDNYESQSFFDKVLEDNPVTTSASGLYDLNEMLVFRGDRVNNYVRFHNMVWRLVKMDPVTHQVYLILDNLKDTTLDIWDNRYNSNEESRNGINDFSVSVVRYTLEDIFDSKYKNAVARMIPTNVCIGLRSGEESNNSGVVECSNVLDEKIFVSLLPVSDYINASTDLQCNTVADLACGNYNYLVSKSGKWWTLTGDASKSTRVYGINYNGAITVDNANSKRYLRYTIVVDGTNLYEQGNGTAENPYMMK